MLQNFINPKCSLFDFSISLCIICDVLNSSAMLAACQSCYSCVCMIIFCHLNRHSKDGDQLFLHLVSHPFTWSCRRLSAFISPQIKQYERGGGVEISPHHDPRVWKSCLQPWIKPTCTLNLNRMHIIHQLYIFQNDKDNHALSFNATNLHRRILWNTAWAQ